MALKNDNLTSVRQRKYLARDFNSLRAQLLEYARLYYPDRLKDFSEASLGGLFLDFAAYVGDVMSFYLDHQFAELDVENAVETSNIEKLLKNAGVPITGAAPAVVPITIYIEVPAQTVGNTISPRLDSLPIIGANSIFIADNSVEFILLENLDFNKTRSDGTLYATPKVGNKTSNGTPTSFILAMTGIAISGKETQEDFIIGDTFVPFREIQLSNANVTEIVSVYDSLGNTYYQVSALTHDVIYRNVLNTSLDVELVPEAIKVIPAPYRYITSVDLANRKTTLTFGGGTADTLEDDIIPDPSEFAISLPYSKTFSRISINPQQLLQTNTLGVAATNTTLTITYRYGGGLSHVVPANSIKTVKYISMTFPGNPSASVAAAVRGSVECTNLQQSSGGEDAPDIDDLKQLIPSIRSSQERIVTKEDLIARVYTIPTNFGRVFRAAVNSNSNNPLATQLFIISRTSDGKLIISPDTLKNNLKTYLNPYRMFSDAIDILDAKIINLSLQFEIVVDPLLNKSIVLQNVLKKLQKYFDIKNFHINQPIIISDLSKNISNVIGIVSIDRIKFTNNVGTLNNVEYSNATFDIDSNTIKGVIIPPIGSIFEIRYPEIDIVGRAI